MSPPFHGIHVSSEVDPEAGLIRVPSSVVDGPWAYRTNGGHVIRHQIPLHDLAVHELSFCLDGRLDFEDAAGTHRLSAGCYVLLAPLQWQRLAAAPQARTMAVPFDGRRCVQWLRALGGGSSALATFLQSRLPEPVHGRFPPTERPRIERLLQELRSMPDDPDVDRAVVHMRLLELIDSCYRWRSNPADTIDDPLVAAALDLLHADPTGRHSTGSVASSLGCSPSWLSRRFSAVVGQGLTVYLRRLRIEMACHLLRDEQMSVAQVGTAAGFEEVAYFSRRFRDMLGCSPSDYRKRLRSGGV